jgi:glycerate kinase
MKESLPVRTARQCLENAVAQAGAEVLRGFCLSDGGDGFLEACEDAFGGELRRVRVECCDPLGNPVVADMLFDETKRLCVIEAALTCGLALVEPAKRDIMASGTAGLGDMIFAAYQMGTETLLIGLGGSATCEGGLGMLGQLSILSGASEAPPKAGWTAQDLVDQKYSLATLPSVLPATTKICTDVRNPLLGPQGAAMVFSPQKGATAEQAVALDGAMSRFADEVEALAESGRNADAQLRTLPGAGAAGGLGFMLSALGGEIQSGAEMLLDQIKLPALLEQADGVITSEGRFDMTSLHGKAPWAAAQAALRCGKRAIIACGSASAEAVAAAADQGVEVIACCEELPVEQRRDKTPEMLTQKLTTYLGRGRAS